MNLKETKDYTRWLCGWLIVGYFMVVLIGLSPIARDDSDPGSWGDRSGLTLRTDSLTGCQYLEAQSGGLTPRLDTDGKHIGCNSEAF